MVWWRNIYIFLPLEFSLELDFFLGCFGVLVLGPLWVCYLKEGGHVFYTDIE